MAVNGIELGVKKDMKEGRSEGREGQRWLKVASVVNNFFRGNIPQPLPRPRRHAK